MRPVNLISTCSTSYSISITISPSIKPAINNILRSCRTIESHTNLSSISSRYSSRIGSRCCINNKLFPTTTVSIRTSNIPVCCICTIRDQYLNTTINHSIYIGSHCVVIPKTQVFPSS